MDEKKKSAENIIGCLWVSDKSALSDDPRWIEEALAWNPRLFRQAFFHRKSVLAEAAVHAPDPSRLPARSSGTRAAWRLTSKKVLVRGSWREKGARKKKKSSRRKSFQCKHSDLCGVRFSSVQTREQANIFHSFAGLN